MEDDLAILWKIIEWFEEKTTDLAREVSQHYPVFRDFLVGHGLPGFPPDVNCTAKVRSDLHVNGAVITPDLLEQLQGTPWGERLRVDDLSLKIPGYLVLHGEASADLESGGNSNLDDFSQLMAVGRESCHHPTLLDLVVLAQEADLADFIESAEYCIIPELWVAQEGVLAEEYGDVIISTQTCLCALDFDFREKCVKLCLEGKPAEDYFRNCQLPHAGEWAWHVEGGVTGCTWVPPATTGAEQAFREFVGNWPPASVESLKKEISMLEEQVVVNEFEESASGYSLRNGIEIDPREAREISEEGFKKMIDDDEGYLALGLAHYRLGVLVGDAGEFEAAKKHLWNPYIHVAFRDRDFRQRIVCRLLHEAETQISFLRGNQ